MSPKNRTLISWDCPFKCNSCTILDLIILKIYSSMIEHMYYVLYTDKHMYSYTLCSVFTVHYRQCCGSGSIACHSIVVADTGTGHSIWSGSSFRKGADPTVSWVTTPGQYSFYNCIVNFGLNLLDFKIILTLCWIIVNSFYSLWGIQQICLKTMFPLL